MDAAGVWRKYPHTPPPPGSRPNFEHPLFTQLRAMVEKDSANSLAERTELWARTQAHPSGGCSAKRKSAPGANGSKGAVARGRTGFEPGGGTIFKTRLQQSCTLSGECHYTWRRLP